MVGRRNSGVLAYVTNISIGFFYVRLRQFLIFGHLLALFCIYSNFHVSDQKAKNASNLWKALWKRFKMLHRLLGYWNFYCRNPVVTGLSFVALNSQSKRSNFFFYYARISLGYHPLTMKPEDSGYTVFHHKKLFTQNFCLTLKNSIMICDF